MSALSNYNCFVLQKENSLSVCCRRKYPNPTLEVCLNLMEPSKNVQCFGILMVLAKVNDSLKNQ